MNQACPLCFGKQYSKMNGIESPRYYYCEQCSLIFMDASFIPTPEEEKARYDTHNNSLENQGYVQMFERFLTNTVYPYVEKGSVALDYGSGPGPVLSILLERQGYPTDIYDPYYAPKSIFEGKLYDLITCTETIEHIKDPASTFTLFSKHLKVGGKLALMTLFYPSQEIFDQWWYRRDPTHIRFYHPNTFRWISQHYPLKIVWVDTKNSLVMERM